MSDKNQKAPAVNGNMSFNQIYEVVGKLYLQLIVLTNEVEELHLQLAKSNAKIQDLEQGSTERNLQNLFKQDITSPQKVGNFATP